jgi:hypothetical protein
MLSSPVLSARPHAHLSGDRCPTCDQPIPNEKLDEVANRLAAKERLLRAEADAQAKEEIQAVRAQGEATLAALKAQLVEREQSARKEGEMLAAAAFEKRLAEHAESAAAKVAEMETARGETERRLAELLASQEETVNGRVAEAREALEKAKTEAVNAERVKGFEEKVKFEGMIADLQRKLQNKTAEELGDSAEIDLFEILKAEFPNDDIQRVGRGKPGADVIHKVRHNGAVCGTIVYDSKNHKQWRTEFVTKLRQDQIAEKAEHAVLATRAFPKDAKQLHIDSGVILADPARAVVVAMLLRQQVIKVHGLAVSNNERASKTEELYSFMTSDRFGQFLSTISVATGKLEELQAAEKKAHESTWKKQGELFRAIVRNCAQFDAEIARIIGTAPADVS